jgi:CRISPR-associated protein Cas5d
MFHGFGYPDETGDGKLHARFWRPTMVDGGIRFVRPEDCTIRKFVREMAVKEFDKKKNFRSVDSEVSGLEG